MLGFWNQTCPMNAENLSYPDRMMIWWPAWISWLFFNVFFRIPCLPFDRLGSSVLPFDRWGRKNPRNLPFFRHLPEICPAWHPKISRKNIVRHQRPQAKVPYWFQLQNPWRGFHTFFFWDPTKESSHFGIIFWVVFWSGGFDWICRFSFTIFLLVFWRLSPFDPLDCPKFCPLNYGKIIYLANYQTGSAHKLATAVFSQRGGY